MLVAVTNGGSRPRPDSEVWADGLRWIEAAYMQASRFEEAFYQLERGFQDAETRRLLNAHERESAREHYDRDYEPYDPQRPVFVPTQSLRMQVANEMDFLLLALRNVQRSEARLPSVARAEMSDDRLVHLLRNVGEHFDHERGWSSEALEKEYPTLARHQVAFTNKEIWIGGLDGVPLSRVRAWLSRTGRAIRIALVGAGADWNLDPKSSAAEGDDAFPWPPERLRYRWDIPQLDEKDWPRTAIPTEVAEVIAQKFLRLRASDPKD